MATEEIEISELELAEELAPDNLIPIESLTDTKATTLQKIKEWLESFFVDKTSEEEVGGQKRFVETIYSKIKEENKDVIKTYGSPKGESKISQYYLNNTVYTRITNKNFTTSEEAFIDIRNGDNGEKVIELYSADTRCVASSSPNSILTTKAITKSAIGKLELGNGIIIQWGVVNVGSYNATGTITFPTPFKSDYQIVTQGERTEGGGQGSLSITTRTLTNANYRNSASAQNYNSTFRWIAIGL